MPLTNDLLAQLTAAMQDSLGAQRIPGAGAYAFRKMTEPLLLPIKAIVNRFDVPDGFFASGGPGYQATSFRAINPNNCYVRLRGSSTSTHVPVTVDTGWLIAPNSEIYASTQYPISMSTLAVVKAGLAVPAQCDPLELIYGGGF